MCRAVDASSDSPLNVSHSIRGSDEDILEGLLRCTNPACQYEYPIIDGVPYLLPHLPTFLAANIQAIQARTDLSDTILSVLGDCCGPGSAFDVERQQLSSYAWCHYGDLDPRNTDTDAGTTAAVLRSFADDDFELPDGPVIDLGCSVGRTTFELAQQTQRMTLGVDLNPAMLRIASRVLRTGQVRFPRRRVGLVYEQREFVTEFAESEKVDFWACDVTALPFVDQQFSRCLCLNTLDSVSSPVALLQSLARIISAEGIAQLACPYDWSSAVTPVEAWLGGHSQRADHQGLSHNILRQLLDQSADLAEKLKIVSERDNIPWTVRLHDRSRMTYNLHAVTLEKQA